MRRYWKYAKPYLSSFIIGPILMIVEVIGEVVMPLLLSNIVFAAAKCQKADGIACPKNDGYNIHIIEKGKALLF